MLADLQQLPRLFFKVVPLFKRIKPVGQTGAKLKLIRKILQLTKPVPIAGVKKRIQCAAADNGKAVREMLLHFRKRLRVISLRLLRIAAAKCTDRKRWPKAIHCLTTEQRAILHLKLRQ